MMVPTVSAKRATENLDEVTANMEVIPASLWRSSGEVWCPRYQHCAAVSVVRRQGATTMIRYVQWCSLRGVEPCSEDCILEPACATLEPAGGQNPLR